MQRYLALVFFSLLCFVQLLAQKQLSGLIVDTEGEPVVAAAVCYEGNDIFTITDENGHFVIAREEGRTLSIRCLGLEPVTIEVNKNTRTRHHITMRPVAQELGEVVYKVKKEKYSRKNNPAVELMKRVIAARQHTDLQRHEYVQYLKYQKISTAVNHYLIDKDSTNQNIQIWNDRVELSPLTGQMIMPISVDETIAQHLYRRDPQKSKEIILAEKSAGLNQMFATGDMFNVGLKDVFQDVDIFHDEVRLLQYPFLSPIAQSAIGFYRYYIKDTVQVGGDNCIHLAFLPNNPQDFGFRGDLWVLNDSSLHVRKCSLTLPHSSDVNFVDQLHVTQEFEPLDNGDWVLSSDEMWAELAVFAKSMLVVRSTRMSDYSFAEIPAKLLSGQAKITHQADSRRKDDAFWLQHRKVELSANEASFDSFTSELQQTRGGMTMLFLLKPLVENYIETTMSSSRPSKIDIGPVMNTFSSNYVDGFRISTGARTTAALNPHLFASGNVAFGFRSRALYYRGEVTYSFNEKEYYTFEFPQRNITFESTYDVMSASDKFLGVGKDNALFGLRTQEVKDMFQYNRQKLSFVYESEGGVSFTTWLMTEDDRPRETLHYISLSDNSELSHMRTTELHVGLRYNPNVTYVNNKVERTPMNYDSPAIELSHTIGIKGFLGGQYTSNLTELSIYKRQWLGSWGHIDMNLDGAIQWNKVPFPLLIMPPTNLTYFQQSGSFSLLRNTEFLMDRKVMWQLHWDMNGKLLNRIPLIKKLKWREHFGYKGIWGQLSDRNNPLLAENQHDAELFCFPQESYAINPDIPYQEVYAGVHNVFKLLQCDVVYRLNYHDHPTTSKWGVRFGLSWSF